MKAEDLCAIVHGKQRQLMDAIFEIYGDDSNTILNALHEMAARVAIATGTPPKEFSAGMKHHWDNLANSINAQGRH